MLLLIFDVSKGECCIGLDCCVRTQHVVVYFKEEDRSSFRNSFSTHAFSTNDDLSLYHTSLLYKTKLYASIVVYTMAKHGAKGCLNRQQSGKKSQIATDTQRKRRTFQVSMHILLRGAVSRDVFDAQTVDTMSSIGWRRKAFSFEHMAQMPATILAGDFDPAHSHAVVFMPLYSIWDFFIKCWPTTAALELRRCRIQRRAACTACKITLSRIEPVVFSCITGAFR